MKGITKFWLIILATLCVYAWNVSKMQTYEQYWECSDCKYVALSENAMMRHLEGNPDCSMFSVKKYGTPKKVSKYTCSNCGFSCRSESEMVKHFYESADCYDYTFN